MRILYSKCIYCNILNGASNGYNSCNNTKQYTPIKVAKINESKKTEAVVVAQTTQQSYKNKNLVQHQVKKAPVQKGSKKFAEQYALDLNVKPGVNEKKLAHACSLDCYYIY